MTQTISKEYSLREIQEKILNNQDSKSVQSSGTANTIQLTAEQKDDQVNLPVGWTAWHAVTISIAVLFYGVFMLWISYRIAKASGKFDVPTGYARVMGLVLVISGSLFLVAAGYSDRQITPVVGLLGTVAGYVLGRSSQDNVAARTTAQTPTNPVL